MLKPQGTIAAPRKCALASRLYHYSQKTSSEESSEKQTTITNTGTVSTTSLTIEGTNWSSGLNNIPTTQTHWSLSSGVSYDSMNDLNLSPSSESLGQNVSPSSPLDVFFKLKVPLNQVSGSYSQTITFTGDC